MIFLENSGINSSGALPQVSILKGLFFVELYAFVEFSVNRIATSSIDFVNSKNIKKIHCRENIICAACDGHFKAMRDLSGERNFVRRFKLLSELSSKDVLMIDNAIFSSIFQNASHSTILLMTNTFYAESPILNDPRAKIVLNEVREKRNEISHGRELPESVGGAYTIPDLKKKSFHVQTIVEGILNSVDECLRLKRFIKPAYRKLY